MWLLAWLVFDVVHAAPEEAPSDEVALQARALFETGKRLYGEGSYQGAIVAWQACYELTEHPELLFNLSNAHERLGDAGRALEFLNEYREKATLGPEEHERLARKATTLERRLGVDSVAPDARRRGRNTAGTLFAAGGGGVMVVGAVLGILALDARQELNATCTSSAGGLLCPASARGTTTRAQRDSTLSLVALGVGGLGVATGVTLIAVPGPKPKAGVQVSWTF